MSCYSSVSSSDVITMAQDVLIVSVPGADRPVHVLWTVWACSLPFRSGTRCHGTFVDQYWCEKFPCASVKCGLCSPNRSRRSLDACLMHGVLLDYACRSPSLRCHVRFLSLLLRANNFALLRICEALLSQGLQSLKSTAKCFWS